MYLKSLFIGIILFLSVFIIHVILWRFCRPQKHISLLFRIFLYIPAMFFVSSVALNFIFKLIDFTELLLIALLYFSIACAYIQTYPAIYVFAPSLRIVYLIGKSMPKGLEENEILAFFPQENMLTDRIDDLILEKMVYTKNNQLYLSLKGKILAKFFSLYRKIYGLEPGNG